MRYIIAGVALKWTEEAFPWQYVYAEGPINPSPFRLKVLPQRHLYFLSSSFFHSANCHFSYHQSILVNMSNLDIEKREVGHFDAPARPARPSSIANPGPL